MAPAVDAMLITRPPLFCRIMSFVAARVMRNAPRRLTSMTRSQSSSFMRTRRPSRMTPALLTRMSTRPNRCLAASTNRSASSRITASATTPRTAPPRASSSLAERWSRSASRPETTTAAPSSASNVAIARPMPRLPPVTIATRPSRGPFWAQHRGAGAAGPGPPPGDAPPGAAGGPFLHTPPPPWAPAPPAPPRPPRPPPATLIGSPRPAGPQPRDVLRLAPPHSPAPLDHGERLPEARRVLDRESPNAVDDAPEESRQDASRPYLDEGRGALGREAQDTIRPPDPARELLEEEGPDLRPGSGHARVDVADHGDRRVGDRDPVELAGELDGGRRHEGAVEGRAHRKQDTLLAAPVAGERGRALHRRPMARDDDLLGRVHVRDADDLTLRRVHAHPLDLAQVEPHDRRHRARPHRHGILHQRAALAHDAYRIGEPQGAGHDERRVFPETVARGERGLEAAFGARGGRRDRRREDRGLGVGGQREVRLRTLEHEPRQVEAERLVRLLEHRLRARGRRVEPLAHPDRLRALAGEEKRDRGHRWSGLREAARLGGWPEKGATRLRPSITIGSGRRPRQSLLRRRRGAQGPPASRVRL